MPGQIRVLGDTGVVALRQAVRDAASDTLVLLVASHPDDQYVLPATYLRFKRGYRVASLLFTRGRGGQNSLGPETGDALGRIRTRESERCARHFGAKIYYLNRKDNGFSRSAAETLEQWRRDSTIRDLARLIRMIKPDVVLTTHHPDELHGHDLALLQVLPKAVAMAADPDVEIPGQPAFLVERVFRSATEAEDDEVTVSLTMDDWDYDRGGTYRQLAYRALGEHRSQSPLRALKVLFRPLLELRPLSPDPKARFSSLVDPRRDLYGVLAGVVPPADLVQLRDVDFPRLPTLLGNRAELARHALELLRRLRAIETAEGSEIERRIDRRVRALQRVVLLSAGVHVFIPEPKDEASPGDQLPLHIWIRNEGDHQISDIAVSAVGGGSLRLEGRNSKRTTLGSHASLVLEALYSPPELSKRDLRTLFSGDTYEPPLRVKFEMAIDGEPFELEQAIDKELQPAVKLTVSPNKILLPRGVDRVRFVVSVERKTRKPVDLLLRVTPPAAMTVDRNVRQVKMQAQERFQEFTFDLNAPDFKPGVNALYVQVGNHRERVHVHKVDVAVGDELRVGLLQGVDNSAYEVLHALIGDRRLVKFETDQSIPILDGLRLQTIVADIRSLRRKNFKRGFARLLEFVEKGGRLVVFYHKDNEFNIDPAAFRGTPFPLRIGKGRVTEEDADVSLLQPDHLLFKFPNRIRRQDWDGWKQERGLYFPESYDRRFKELIEIYDRGQAPERGSLLYARYGKGEYIYCALALYRQLKIRHAGACRLFANLVSPQQGPR